VNVDINVRC